MAPDGKSAEIKAGVIVLIGLFILALGLFLVSGGLELFRTKRTYTVLMLDGGEIAEGSAVFVAGRKRGTVLHLEDRVAPSPEGEQRTYVAVEIEVDSDARILKGSDITIAKTITGQVSMNIRYGPSQEPADPEEFLYGRRLATFDEVVDEGRTLLLSVKGVVGRLESAAERVELILEGVDIADLAEQAHEFMRTLNRSAVEIEGIVKESREPVQVAVRDLSETATRVKGFIDSVQGGWDQAQPRIQGTLTNAEGATAAFRNIAEENRETIRSMLKNLEDATFRIQPVFENVEGFSEDLRETMAEIRPHITATLKSARHALANFDSITEDLETSPWKLARKPSSSETREVHLFNAARQYVLAAESVRSQIDDLDTLNRLGVLAEEEPSPVIGQVLERLRQSLEEYEKREQELVRLMNENRGD